MATRNFWRRLAFVLAAYLGSAVAVVTAQTTPAPTPPGKPAQELAADALVKGTTRCAADLSLALPATGMIAHIPVKEGAFVRRGDLLLSLDRKAEELDVERRRVQWQGQAEIVTAKARKETAEVQVIGARRIFSASQGISREELENRELAFATTMSELERLKTVKEMERLDYLTARENLARRNLVSPSLGIVTKLIKQVGESLQANEAVIRLCDLRKILFVANVPSSRSDYLRVGSIVDLTVGHLGMKTKGKLIFVSPVVDPASGLREIKLELIRPSADIRPGVPASLYLGM